MSSKTMKQLEQQVVASVDGQLNPPVMTHTGQVKWFNNKLCYGFIKVISDGDSLGEDIFVHQKNITPNVSEWRSLRLGEYVSFQLGNTNGTKQAINVRGVNGGPLMVDEQLKSRNERRDHVVSNIDGNGNIDGHTNGEGHTNGHTNGDAEGHSNGRPQRPRNNRNNRNKRPRNDRRQNDNSSSGGTSTSH